ncbi:MAG: 2-phospho-L-lactate transferase [Acidimicrobiales bacterium]|jgi:LPPG:FO 2-phospho-L-lactate transferase|nr:2-phospho-L-lactate transferase [Acidimicrobiales bacterium]
MHTVLAGGVGAARYLRGALEAFDPTEVTAVVNVGDDVMLHGLRVCPDLDTCTYTLAGAIDPERGWGLVDESWQAMAELGRYGGENWFSLGDRDLGTHLFRTQRLDAGASLTEVTAEITSAWGLQCRLLPVSDDPVETRVTLADGDEINFQEYFVRLQHDVAVSSVRFDGVDAARPTDAAIAAIDEATTLVIAPSNPIVSIGPVLAVPGVRERVEARRDRNVAVSPIVGGKALKGPADRMLRELGEEPTVVGVARRYRDLAATLVVDEVDAVLVPEIEAAGMRAIAMPTIMSEPGVAPALARACHEAGGTP